MGAVSFGFAVVMAVEGVAVPLADTCGLLVGDDLTVPVDEVVGAASGVAEVAETALLVELAVGAAARMVGRVALGVEIVTAAITC